MKSTMHLEERTSVVSIDFLSYCIITSQKFNFLHQFRGNPALTDLKLKNKTFI